MLNWVELDRSALRHNLSQFRGRIGTRVLLGAVVKSNAYGHGILEVGREALAGGAQWLCVNGIEEGCQLRDAGIEAPIIVLGYVALADMEELVRRDLRTIVYREESLDALAAAARAQGRRVRIHIKLETGTNRQGVLLQDLPGFLSKIQKRAELVLEGVSTHFANIEDTTDHRFAEGQLQRFLQLSAMAGERMEDGARLLRHAACSAAVLLFPETHFEMVRLGISLYGVWPSRETLVSCKEQGAPILNLSPVLSWKTRIGQIKMVPEGEYIGYGCTFRATRPTRIGVLPVGYYEGYDRRLSGQAYVLVHGRRAQIRGRICMNMCMVDLTDIPGVEPEDEVVLIGRQGDEYLGADQLAAWCGTIPYEILTGIYPGLPRVWVGG
ncbi:MAG: alanine racemase [Verrucomicrobiota bacterium]|jgi:alanine racemase